MDLALLADQPTLRGELVVLEPLTAAHAQGLVALHAAPDELDGPLAALAWERARRAVAAAAARQDRADWAICTRADTSADPQAPLPVVGEAVLFQLDEVHESMEFRIALLGPQVFGRGYGTEATRLVRDFALGPLGLHRLSLHVSAANAAALRIYEKAGFVLEGRRRQVTLQAGQWVDELDYALLADDPRP